VRDHCTEAGYGVVPGRQRMKVRQWPLLGALLVVSFLGHDLLMAAATAAVPLAEIGTAHHSSIRHAPTGEPPTLQIHGPTSEHPENCRIGQSAVPRSGDPFERADRDFIALDCVVGTIATSAHAGAFLWEEPHWPPGTLRALFQVYRI
jgi:hypothetical protein